MQNYFRDLIKITSESLENKEKFTAWFSAECMDFARFNHAKIRQAGTVNQYYLSINLINGQKHVNTTLGLNYELHKDKELIDKTIKKMRFCLTKSDIDPFFLISEEVNSTESIFESSLPKKEEIIFSLLKESSKLDLVGSYIGGPVYRGFANSFGQFNWFQKSSFIIDTSIYYKTDQAIKQSYASTSFDENILKNKVKEARLGLELFTKPKVNLEPGNYRTYFSPTALYEIFSLLNWGAFSKKSLLIKNSPFLSLKEGQKTLAKDFSIYENSLLGMGPKFQTEGFLKPDKISIIENGRLIEALTSPKTAKEYGLNHNGAAQDEAMTSIDMIPGSLKDEEILNTLDEGLFINNLWYLNYSDRQNACITGMTRFLCYLVKNGKPVANFGVMRFDDSIYRIFGSSLSHITKERELIVDKSTYEERATACALLPGIIVKDVRFTL